MTRSTVSGPAISGPAPLHLRGVIEGFYGAAWSWEDRFAYPGFLARLRLNAYLYAPKADRFLRRDWARHWPVDEWARLLELSRRARDAGVAFGVGLSPFRLYADYGPSARRRLAAKIRRLNELEAPLLAILFDDMPGDQADLAARQVEIVRDCLERSNASRLLVCPTYYSSDPILERVFGERPEGYWERLGEGLPPEAEVFWTGPQVCADALAVADIEGINRRLQRPVVIWDNYPVNDGAKRSQHLYLEAPPGRSPGLAQVSRGHFCNGMNQAHLTLPALAGLADLSAETHGAGALLPDLLGAETWHQLREDRELFRDQRLDDLASDRRRELGRRYEALATPAAREVQAWLRGEYRFDPDCLTD